MIVIVGKAVIDPTTTDDSNVVVHEWLGADGSSTEYIVVGRPEYKRYVGVCMIAYDVFVKESRGSFEFPLLFKIDDTVELLLLGRHRGRDLKSRKLRGSLKMVQDYGEIGIDAIGEDFWSEESMRIMDRFESPTELVRSFTRKDMPLGEIGRLGSLELDDADVGMLCCFFFGQGDDDDEDDIALRALLCDDDMRCKDMSSQEMKKVDDVIAALCQPPEGDSINLKNVDVDGMDINVDWDKLEEILAGL